MPQRMRVFLVSVCAVAVASPTAARAEELTWQQVYKCSLFASSVAEFSKDQGRDGSRYEKEFDALVAVAMRLHHTQYSRQHPKATGADWQRDFDTDTSQQEDAFLEEMDKAPAAADFLQWGYLGCSSSIAYATKGAGTAR
jgi:hypothetical protein